MIDDVLLEKIRGKFAHVDACPFQGPRAFFENAGGALTLNSAVETSARFAAIPDNQGRDNPAAHALMDIIAEAKSAAMEWFNAHEDCTPGQVFVGESGTELLFRLIRTAVCGTSGGVLIGSNVEHPATRSAMGHWAEKFDRDYRLIAHDDALGLVSADAYAAAVTPDTKVATILHTSPVTGMGMDVAAISAAIKPLRQRALSSWMAFNTRHTGWWIWRRPTWMAMLCRPTKCFRVMDMASRGCRIG